MVDENKLQEMQILEQRLQNSILQKQAFQMELAETNSAMKELEKSGEEVYKIVGQLMIKTQKEKVHEELLEKKKLLEVRIKSLEKQEASFSEKLEKIREELTKPAKK